MNHKTVRSTGFTLLEMALILVLVGVVISTALPRLLSDMSTGVAKRSKASVVEARDEIVGYALNPNNSNKLPSKEASAGDVVPQTLIKANSDGWDHPLTYILPNVNATNGALWTNNVCSAGSTGLTVTTPSATTDDVAFVVASTGQNALSDLSVTGGSNPGDTRTVTTLSYGADSAVNNGEQFDDIVEFVTLSYLKSLMDCTDTTPPAPGTPSGTIPLDSTSDANTSFQNGASTVDTTTAGGGIGEVLELDGTNDAVQITNSDAYALDTYTIMGWFKCTAPTSETFHPIIARQGGDSNHRTFWVVLWDDAYGDQGHVNGEVAFKAAENDNSGSFETDTDMQTTGYPSPYQRDGDWHFFAVTMEDLGESTDINGTPDADPGDNQHRSIMYTSGDVANDLFVTPTTQTSATRTRGPDDNTGYTMYIGRDPDYAGRYFAGYIDEIKIYNYALTATEVGQWYNATRPYYPN